MHRTTERISRSAPRTPLWGRSAELAELRRFLEAGGPGLAILTGPRGRGKTALLARVLRGREALHFQAAELTEADLLQDLRGLALTVLGEVPMPRRPGVLPLGSGAGGWLSFLIGLVDRVEASGRPFVLVLDGMEALLGARRRLAGELGEAFRSARVRNLPLQLILTARQAGTLGESLEAGGELGTPELALALSPLPFRVAGWAHGGRNAGDAFRRWALFGDHPAHLPPGSSATTLGEAVRQRVLHPAGDLFEAPLRRLEGTFQRPGRYVAILRALSHGPLEWSGILDRAAGVDSGGQLAPYLRRLEEEGLIRVDLPLGARPESRSRRYSVSDPFLAFWFGWVLPRRSLLAPGAGRAIWRRRILPELDGHFQSWMEEAARRWLREHAAEELGAPAREAGALWGEGPEFPVAGRLANGQVCFGLVDGSQESRDLAGEMSRRMQETRYGIGREARAPLFFLSGRENEAIRRNAARNPLARVVALEGLMGQTPGTERGGR